MSDSWFGPWFGSSGGGGDVTPPVVANLTPAPGQLAATYDQARSTPITFDVTDVNPGIELLLITVKLGNQRVTWIVFDGTKFLPPFDQYSLLTVIANGFHFAIRMNDDGREFFGWPSTTIQMIIYAVDSAGNITP